MATRSTTSEYQPAPPHNRQQRGGGRKAGKQTQNVKVQRTVDGANRSNVSGAPLRQLDATANWVQHDRQGQKEAVSAPRIVTVHPSINTTSE